MKHYLINLDRRTDRLSSAQREFDNNGMRFSRISARDMIPGWMGCLQSHLSILSNAQENVFGIWEDDIKILYAPIMPIVSEMMCELPDDWDMLYLGCSPQEPFEKYSHHLYKMGKNHTTHAIIWHNRENGALRYIISKEWDMKYDLLLSEHIHPNFNCFCAYPLLVSQHQTQSDCCKRSDLSTIQKNYKKHIL